MTSSAQQNSLMAIDIALEPDATMIHKAQADNARLLRAFPKGFALDATHHAHVAMLQQFVSIADLDKVYAAVGEVFASEKPATWKLTSFKHYYIPAPPIGVAGIAQPLAARDGERAMQAADDADVLLAVGSTLQVYPVAGAVPRAKAAGARVVIINAEPTRFDDIADAVALLCSPDARWMTGQTFEVSGGLRL